MWLFAYSDPSSRTYNKVTYNSSSTDLNNKVVIVTRFTRLEWQGFHVVTPSFSAYGNISYNSSSSAYNKVTYNSSSTDLNDKVEIVTRFTRLEWQGFHVVTLPLVPMARFHTIAPPLTIKRLHTIVTIPQLPRITRFLKWLRCCLD